jgi:hypothetical protein
LPKENNRELLKHNIKIIVMQSVIKIYVLVAQIVKTRNRLLMLMYVLWYNLAKLPKAVIKLKTNKGVYLKSIFFLNKHLFY